jgi:two-component system, OmpR family, response regulator MprA
MRILVVEDDARMAELLKRGLAADRHSVDVEGDGPAGLERARTHPYDTIVLDVMLPGLDGLGVVRKLRSAGIQTPILMLTARDGVSDIVRGLDIGADDYLTKPFSFDVLRARLRVMARRTGINSGRILQVADLTIATDTHRVRRADRLILLTRTEYLLLELLMKRAGRVVSRDALIEAAWGGEQDVSSNALDVFVFQLRTKLEAGGAPRLLQTVRGFGYVLREPEIE